MTRLLPLLIFAGLAAELASIILVGRALGVVLTLLLLFGGGLLGMSLIKSAGAGIAETLRGPVQARSLQQGAAGMALARVVAGLLFIIPGFVSDVAAILLLLPPVRAWLRSRIRVESFSATSPQPRRHGTVIDAEAVEIVAEVESPPRRDGRDPGEG